MELDEALTTTRAVRRRLDLDRPVERSVVEECLSLALQAPNGSNRQLWRWILIDDPEVREKVAGIYRAALDGHAASGVSADKPVVADRSLPEVIRMSASVMHLRDHLEQVPVLVLPLLAGRVDGASIFYQASMWGSVLPAVWSLMLALRSRGMGSAWTTIHLHQEAQMAQLLGIPPEYTQVGLFPVAYTIGTDFGLAGRRPLREVASWNSFGGEEVLEPAHPLGES
jgi:nitroreductase